MKLTERDLDNIINQGKELSEFITTLQNQIIKHDEPMGLYSSHILFLLYKNQKMQEEINLLQLQMKHLKTK